MQQNIDFGTFPDDPSADAIRTAFQKVQENFDEVYASTANAAVLSVNRTAGRGITVNAPTGNVIVEANVASISISSVTLKVGTTPNPVTNSAIYTNFSQTLYVEIPNTLSISNLVTSGNISAGGNLTSLNASLGNAVVANYFIGDGNQLSNVTANIANTANVAGTVSQNAQSNITSLGTLTSLSVSGNIIAGNVYANVGIIGAQYLKGDGSNITNLSIAGANVSGTVSSANTAGTVTTNAQPNITSVGILSSVSVSGNANIGNVGTGIITATGTITGGNLATTGTLSAGGNATLGNLSVTGLLSAGDITVGSISNGTSNVDIVGVSGNVITSVAGVANVLVVTTTGANIAGNLSASGNINAGNVTATTFTGALSGTATSATTAGTVTTNAQSNITSLGTLTSLAVSGNSNLGAVGNVKITGGANLSYLYTDGAGNLTFGSIVNTPPGGANNDVQFKDGGTYQGSSNFTFDPTSNIVSITGTLSVIGNANVGNIGATNIVGTLTTNAQPNITSLGQLTALSLLGNLNSNSDIITNTGNISAGGNVTGAYILGNGSQLTGIAAATAGTVTTNAQPNITSTGTLTDLSVGNSIVLTGASGYGTVTTTQFSSIYAKANGLNATSLMQVKGNDGTNGMGMRAVTGSSALIYSNSSIDFRVGSTIRDLDTPTGGTNIATIASTGLTVTGVVSASGNVTGGNANLGNAVTANYFIGNLYGTANLATYATTANAVAGANVSDQVGNALVAGTVYTNAQPNITSVGTLTSLSASGNITGANIIATNYHIRSVDTGILAAGSTQGDGTILTKEFNQVSTVSSGQGVVLPSGVAGMAITIINSSANSLLVYPASGGAINSLSTNASYSHPAAGTLQYITLTGTQWYTLTAVYV